MKKNKTIIIEFVRIVSLGAIIGGVIYLITGNKLAPVICALGASLSPITNFFKKDETNN